MDILNQQVIEQIRQMARGDTGKVTAILDSFERDSHTLISQMQQAHHQGDLATLQKHAHTLKGLSGTIGAEQLQSHCRSIELATQAQDAAELSELLDNLPFQQGFVLQALGEV